MNTFGGMTNDGKLAVAKVFFYCQTYTFEMYYGKKHLVS